MFERYDNIKLQLITRLSLPDISSFPLSWATPAMHCLSSFNHTIALAWDRLYFGSSVPLLHYIHSAQKATLSSIIFLEVLFHISIASVSHLPIAV